MRIVDFCVSLIVIVQLTAFRTVARTFRLVLHHIAEIQTLSLVLELRQHARCVVIQAFIHVR